MHSKTPHWIVVLFAVVVALAILLTIVQQYGGQRESYKSKTTQSGVY